MPWNEREKLSQQEWRKANPEKVSKQGKRYYDKHMAEVLNKHQKYKETHKLQIKESNREYYLFHKEKYRINSKKYRELHRKEIKHKLQEKFNKLRLEVLTHYGGSPPKCACCGELIVRFLTIDHVNGDGNKHRREIKSKTIYKWLIDNNFPDGFQVLCMNCNWGRQMNNGVCPHKEGEKYI